MTEQRTLPPEGAASIGSSGDATNIVQALFAAYNAADREGFTKLLASDATQTELPADLVYQGADEITANFWAYRSTFPNLQVTLADCFASGDRAVAQLVQHGTYEPSTYGRSAKTITWYVCHVIRLRDSKITEITTYADRLSMLHQLGALALSPEVLQSGGPGFLYQRVEPVVGGPWKKS